MTCWANAALVMARVKTTPANAMNDFLIFVPSPRRSVHGGATVRAVGNRTPVATAERTPPGADMRWRYRPLAAIRNDVRICGRTMQPIEGFMPRFRVVAGHTYSDPLQVFNRCLMPVYQASYRLTGN